MCSLQRLVRLSYLESLCLQEDDADRRGSLEIFAGGSQPARFLVDTENYDIVGVLVRCQKIGSRRIDGEVTRRFTLCRDVLNQRERVGARVDRKHGDAVVAAI